MRAMLLATAMLAAACQAPRSAQPALPPPQGTQEPEQVPELDRAAAAEPRWSVRLRFPVDVGYTEIDLRDGIPFDSLTAFSVVPTAEFVRPLSAEWTLVPYVGLGGGWVLDDDLGIWILSGGIRAEWERELGQRNLVRVVPRLRYDANLNRPDGLLGDWGRLGLSVELRHAIGRPERETRFAPGVYARGFWYWNDIEFEVPGVTPESTVHDGEVGLSFGTRGPLELFGFELPRVFVGYRFAAGLDGLVIRFGEL